MIESECATCGMGIYASSSSESVWAHMSSGQNAFDHQAVPAMPPCELHPSAGVHEHCERCTEPVWKDEEHICPPGITVNPETPVRRSTEIKIEVPPAISQWLYDVHEAINDVRYAIDKANDLIANQPESEWKVTREKG